MLICLTTVLAHLISATLLTFNHHKLSSCFPRLFERCAILYDFQMRLLRLKSDGDFSLVEYIGDEIPQYAILSHTWGADRDEVNITDLAGGTAKEKAGY